MRNSDTGKLVGDLGVALGLLTRLPLQLPDLAYARGAKAAWAYPVAGWVVGAIAALVAFAAQALGLPAPAAALLVLTCLILLTGAMHEDGLADLADGFWGGWDRDRRLQIMKDSQIGSYGVIALVLIMAGRWWGLGQLLAEPQSWATLVAVAGLSRAGMPALMAALPPARTTGLSRSQGRPSWTIAWIALGLALGLALILIGVTALPLALLLLFVTAAMGLLAKRKIGGQTGDVLGASQQLAEVTLLLALAC